MLLPLLPTAAHTPAYEGNGKQVPVKVEVKQINGLYRLFRDGQPYFVRGAGGGKYPERIAAYGGNSIRTWGTDQAPKVLSQAHKSGLTVMMGLYVAPERHGFNYSDPERVKAQYERIKEEVLTYKDDPAILIWGIGNELNLDYKNPKVWDAVNDIAKMIHEIDPNHPTTTVLAGVGPREVELIKTKCTALDLLSINTYAGLASLPSQLEKAGWTGPYLVTEWGPTGHWECMQTPWKASVEETSSEKAAVYRSRYEASVLKDTSRCMGSYVFLWGQKQERTPTWYGVFTEDGEESEVVDVMQYLWSGRWPENRAPKISYFSLNGQRANQNIYLNPDQKYDISSGIIDPEKDSVIYRYELLPESTDLKVGGDRESRPEPIRRKIEVLGSGEANLTAPKQPGAYRLYVYATDGHGNVATGNIPFMVR